MKAAQVFGFVVAALASAWASFTFFRGSIFGAPPLHSRGLLQRTLHFVAGIIFGVLAVGAFLKLAGKW
jgi:hypothetical protein